MVRGVLSDACYRYFLAYVFGVAHATETATGSRPVPRWLRIVLSCDRAGSAWYIGAGFFFAPVLAVASPWPAFTMALWWIIGLAGLWLGLLGIAMATGLALVLRSGAELPEQFWRSIIDYPLR